VSTKSAEPIVGLDEKERKHFKRTKNLSKSVRYAKKVERRRKRRSGKDTMEEK